MSYDDTLLMIAEELQDEHQDWGWDHCLRAAANQIDEAFRVEDHDYTRAERRDDHFANYREA